ncbi:MAG: acyltransferase [Bacteroidales bacterium]|nr:acyltransferase [Bacteroidales bacterium]
MDKSDKTGLGITSANEKPKIFFENLDGLRFFCFLSVFLFHSFHTEFDYIKSDATYLFIKKFLFANGNLGVNFFFVISGFLITFLLIKEKEQNGQINLKNFWMRRILRIWPMFYFCVFFGFVIFPFIKTLFGQTPCETANWIYYVTFTNNFDFIVKGLPDASILGVLWSVAIEEQFYLIWPIILYLLPKKKYWIAFTTAIAGSLIFRAINIDNPAMLENHTLSCIGDLATGAMGAWLINEKTKFRQFIENLKKHQIGILYISFTIIFLFRKELLMSIEGIRIFERELIAIIIMLIILEQCYAENSLFKMKNLKTVSNLGIITYGLYCLHFIGILITINLTRILCINTHLWQVICIDMPLSLLISILIAKISYRIYEKPFLKLKNRFAYFSKGE